MNGAATKAWGQHEAWPRGEAVELPRYYIVETERRREQQVADILGSIGFPTYLPLVTVVKRAGRSTRVVTEPMFLGYVFAMIDLKRQNWQRIYSTLWCRGVLGAVVAPGCTQPMPLSAIDIARIHGMADHLATEAPVDESGKPLRIGDDVHIMEGPFAGFSGPIARLDGEDRIAVLLSIFGRQTPTICSLAQLARSR